MQGMAGMLFTAVLDDIPVFAKAGAIVPLELRR